MDSRRQRSTIDDMDSWRQRSGNLFSNRVMELHNRLQNTGYRFLGIGITHLQFIQTRAHLLEQILRRAHFPSLLWLSWYDCPYSYLPSWIPVKNLRVLKVRGTVFEALWRGRSQAPIQLRELEIFGDLLKIPKSIGQLTHLERISFSSVSFQNLPEEFCQMRCLKVLEFGHCQNLRALPDSFGNLTNLQHLNLSYCSSLETLSESFGNLMNLEHIELSECSSLQRLPESLRNLTKVEHIKLSGCSSLQRLPESFGNLTKLKHIELFDCRSLQRLPESFGNLMNLEHIELSGYWKSTNLEDIEDIRLPLCDSLRDSLQRLPWWGSLERLPWCGSLQRLPESFFNLKNLSGMLLSNFPKLERLPESLGNLTNLEQMDLSYTGLESLPRLKALVSLKELTVTGCSKLKSIPDLAHLTSLESLDVESCLALEELDGVEQCMSLLNLVASGCRNLKLSEGVVKKLRQRKVKGDF